MEHPRIRFNKALSEDLRGDQNDLAGQFARDCLIRTSLNYLGAKEALDKYSRSGKPVILVTTGALTPCAGDYHAETYVQISICAYANDDVYQSRPETCGRTMHSYGEQIFQHLKLAEQADMAKAMGVASFKLVLDSDDYDQFEVEGDNTGEDPPGEKDARTVCCLTMSYKLMFD